ncbi:MAG: hypothetical protein Q4C44_01580 [bacterium]|nr:hypothetical protein [bacterium]
MNDNNEKKIKIYVALLITVICVIGVSYAWFRLYLSQSENNKITARTCFDVSFTENTDKISLVDAVPEDDSDGLREKPFTFTLKNNCEGYVKAYITIDSAYRTSTSSSYLKDNQVKVNVSPKGTVVSNGMLLTAGELMEIDNNNKGYVINVTGLESNEEKSFDLRLWMDGAVTQSDGLNKTWEGSVVVSAVAENHATWTNPGEGTLLAAIKKDNTVTIPITIPGTDVSSDNEAILASTTDDYGTSYYFRGAVTNNFVEYANMCWRIVRVTGDGSIKLVLYNYNGLTSTNNTPASSTPCNVTGDTYAYARYDGDTYYSEFNSGKYDNAYVGFMYGAASTSSYVEAHANTNASTILINLNKWYTNVLSKQANFSDSQLADTIWCNDKSVVTDATFNPERWTLGTNYGYAKNKNYYGAAKRLVQASSFSAGGTGPSLICPNDNNGGKLSKFTVSDTTNGNGALSGYAKVGLLTADEIAFAGGTAVTTNSTYYIKGNANSDHWWALSPNGFSGLARVWFVNGSSGSLDYSVGNGRGVRPSLSLVSNIKISSGTGTGTATNPYKIAF